MHENGVRKQLIFEQCGGWAGLGGRQASCSQKFAYNFWFPTTSHNRMTIKKRSKIIMFKIIKGLKDVIKTPRK